MSGRRPVANWGRVGVRLSESGVGLLWCETGKTGKGRSATGRIGLAGASMAEDGSDLRQPTLHSGWDVRNPSLDAGRVVSQLGAALRLLDLWQNGSLEKARFTWVSTPRM